MKGCGVRLRLEGVKLKEGSFAHGCCCQGDLKQLKDNEHTNGYIAGN